MDMCMHPAEKYMKRAIHLAEFGYGHVSPNPMVGAVIVAPDGKIIGEGWHRQYGFAHAEVNAINSVQNIHTHLLPESTIYVTLEPCSHYGKTPPCSKLLIEKRIKRAVIGCADPFKEVSGRGIKMMRDAGIEVIVPFMEQECIDINRKFITAHSLCRPYIMLKWAQSEDGFIGKQGERTLISNPLSIIEMHRERAGFDAIIAGTDTIINDNPGLDNRLWSGNSPRPVVIKSSRIPADAKILSRNPIILDSSISLEENLDILYRNYNITSLLVEGGTKLITSFLSAGLFDEIRVETAPFRLFSGINAPTVPTRCKEMTTHITRGNLIINRVY